MINLPPQFVPTKVVPAGNGKTDKIPFDPATGRNIDHLNPKNWLSYESACAKTPTVGFVLTEQDPYVFQDYDGCVFQNEAGQTVWSLNAIDLVKPYLDRGAAWEYSISGTGLHVLCTAEQALMTPLRSKLEGWRERYNWGRFIQFGGTGHGAWTGNPNIDCTSQLVADWPAKDLGDAAGIPEEGPREDWIGPESDEELLQIILTSRKSAAVAFNTKAAFKDLWIGNQEVLSYFFPSATPGKPWDASSAEAALAGHLAFWTGKDIARMERMIKRSKVRHDPENPKYQRKSYVFPTIYGAARLGDSVYQNKARKNQ